MKKRTIRVGKLVRYTGKFLNGIAWHFDVPINGIVLAIDDPRSDGSANALVVFCDRAGEKEPAIRVLISNLELFPATRDAIYPELVAKFSDQIVLSTLER